MTLRIETCSPDRLDVVTRYCEVVFGHRRESYYRWRFIEFPHTTTFLGMVESRCATLLSAIRKRYWIAGARRDVLEIIDWSTHPEFRGKGLGADLLSHVMHRGPPTFAFGGSPDTQRIMPRLGWRVLAESQSYALPLRGSYVRRKLGDRGALAATLSAAGFEALGRAWFRPRRRRRAGGVRIVPVTGYGAEIASEEAGRFHALVASPDLDILDWVDRALPRPGQYLRFTAYRDGRPSGWGLARLRVEGAVTTGEIVDLFSVPPSEDLYVQLIAEMAACLAGLGADGVGTTASCPLVQKALEANHFIRRMRFPVLAFFPEGAPDLIGPLHVMRGTSDDLYLPLPSEVGTDGSPGT